MNKKTLVNRIFEPKKLKNFERADKKKLLDNIGFLGLGMDEWDEFSKFLIGLDKELKSSKSIRHIILSSSIAIEHFIDLIFNRMYSLDKYKRFNYQDFLSGLTFTKKINYLRDLKKIYKKKMPRQKEYIHHFKASLAFYKELRNYKNISKKIERINEILNKRDGIEKPMWSNIYVANPEKKSQDYLSDELFVIVHKVDLSKLEKIRDMRNIVAHQWDYPQKIKTLLEIKNTNNLEDIVRTFCTKTLDSMIKK
jgi:hypothetical protein